MTAEERGKNVACDATSREEIARRVKQRRLQRRFKAAASLMLAAVAGTFVACFGRQKDGPAPAPNPTTPEVSNLPAPPAASATARSATPAQPSGRSGEPPVSNTTDAGVDRTEHRKGMPVPDNLLE